MKQALNVGSYLRAAIPWTNRLKESCRGWSGCQQTCEAASRGSTCAQIHLDFLLFFWNRTPGSNSHSSESLLKTLRKMEQEFQNLSEDAIFRHYHDLGINYTPGDFHQPSASHELLSRFMQHFFPLLVLSLWKQIPIRGHRKGFWGLTMSLWYRMFEIVCPPPPHMEIYFAFHWVKEFLRRC